MNRRSQLGWFRILGGAFFVCSALVFGQTGTFDWTNVPFPYPGVQIAHYNATPPNDPRTMSINCVKIKTTTPNLRFAVTPRCAGWVLGVKEYVGQTTENFLIASRTTNEKVVVSMNANFYGSTPPILCGLAVSKGVMVAAGNGWYSFLVSKAGVPSFSVTNSATDLTDVFAAVTGYSFGGVNGLGIVLSNGTPLLPATGYSLRPRTGIGISADTQYVYFMTIDGDAAGNPGAYMNEAGAYLKYFGAYNGINMDGGGSTKMAWWDPVSNSCKRLTVNQENRAAGNNIGIYYEQTGSQKETLIEGRENPRFSVGPNPFNPSLRISYTLPHPTAASVSVWNALGERMASWPQRMTAAGGHSFSWDAGKLGSGVYFVMLEAPGIMMCEKAVLVR